MTDSNRLRLTMVEESSFGTTPTNPAMIPIPCTSQDLADQIGYAQSRIIRNTRDVQDLVRLSLGAGGSVPMELVWGDAATGASSTMEATYAIVRAAMSAAAATAVADVASCTTTVGAKTITRASGDFTTDFEVGDIVRVSGSTAAADDGYYRVATVVALTLTVERPSNFTGSVGNVAVRRGARMKNGTTDRSFSVEAMHTDGTTNLHQLFTGMVVDGFDLNISDGAISTLGTRFVGKTSTTDTSTDLPGTPTFPALQARPVMDCIGVPTFYVGGAAYAAKSIRISTTMNSAARTQVGALGAQSVRRGAFVVTGEIEAYFSSWTEADKFRNNTASDLMIVARDSAGNAWSFSLPQVKYSSGSVSTPGQDADEMVRLSFQAIVDPTELVTMRFQVFAA